MPRLGFLRVFPRLIYRRVGVPLLPVVYELKRTLIHNVFTVLAYC